MPSLGELKVGWLKVPGAAVSGVAVLPFLDSEPGHCQFAVLQWCCAAVENPQLHNREPVTAGRLSQTDGGNNGKPGLP